MKRTTIVLGTLLWSVASTPPATAQGGVAETAPLATASGDVGTATGEGTWTEWIRSRMPEWLTQGEFAGLAYWQWLGILLVVFVGLLVDLLVRRTLHGLWRRYSLRRLRRAPDRELVRRALRPFGLAAGAVVWYFGLPLLGLPETALLVVHVAVRVLLVLAAAWAAFRVIDLFTDFLMRKAEATVTRFDDVLVPLLRKTLKVFAAAVGLVYMADAFRVEIVPLLTGLGIGGLAFAFAAKDSIENFFGSVAVILDRPFEIGDWVVIEGVEGTVEELGLRSTRIRTFYNSQVSLPNSTLVRARVDNYGRRRFRRFKTHIDLTYDTPPERIEAFCAGIRELILVHPFTRKDYFHVWLNEFGPASLRVLVYMFHETPDWATELRERHRFMLDVIRLAARLQVEFAFPTQTLHVYSEQHGNLSEPPPTPGAEEESGAAELGCRAVRDLTADAPWRTTRPDPVRFGGAATTEAGDEPPPEKAAPPE
ncbi:MAG: mechanosensitive ion channel family protein [Deltaproteobacteria bacterium]|nr:mechanosensitive ion channel family protein [Deltaproteobacteria bacterium]